MCGVSCQLSCAWHAGALPHPRPALENILPIVPDGDYRPAWRRRLLQAPSPWAPTRSSCPASLLATSGTARRRYWPRPPAARHPLPAASCTARVILALLFGCTSAAKT